MRTFYVAIIGSLLGGALLLSACKPKDACAGPNPPASCSACTGCMSGDACQPGNVATACGLDGGACVACANGQACRRDGTCGIDLDARWSVEIRSATINSVDQNNQPWPGNEFYVNLFCPTTE